MAKKQYTLVQAKMDEKLTQAQSQAFQQNLQIALLLSLLDKNLLTQWQFEQCKEQLS